MSEYQRLASTFLDSFVPIGAQGLESMVIAEEIFRAATDGKDQLLFAFVKLPLAVGTRCWPSRPHSSKKTGTVMSSIETQFPEISEHHAQYPAIDPGTTLKGSAVGRVVLISGASSGIGRATAVAFAQAGAKAVYVTARSPEALEETKAMVGRANPETACAYQLCDVTDEAQVKAAVEDSATRFGVIDVVDANAGYLGEWKKIGESDPASWWRTWKVNLEGTYYVVRYTVPHTPPYRSGGRGGLRLDMAPNRR